jgi:hypothetical protein
MRRSIDDAKRVLDLEYEALAIRRQSHASRVAFEQCHAEPVLHSRNPPADGAVRDAGNLCGRQKRPLTCDGANHFKVGKRWTSGWRRKRCR